MTVMVEKGRTRLIRRESEHGGLRRGLGRLGTVVGSVYRMIRNEDDGSLSRWIQGSQAINKGAWL